MVFYALKRMPAMKKAMNLFPGLSKCAQSIQRALQCTYQPISHSLFIGLQNRFTQFRLSETKEIPIRMPCVYTNPCVSIVSRMARHRLSENRLDHRALPAASKYQRMPDFRRRFLQVCVNEINAELQCASHTLRKRKAARRLIRIFLPRYHFHDDRIV